MEPFVGEIRLFGGNFAPSGWMFCEGQLLPISENEVLFQLIGTTYGGDGQSTFAIPDLRGRVPVHQGTLLPSGDTYQMGEMGGVETVSLTENQIPSHNHPVTGPMLPAYAANPGRSSNPEGNYPAISPGLKQFSRTRSQDKLMAAPSADPAQILAPSGDSQPHENMQPFLVVNYIISLFGIFPTSG